ncbi:MAG: hypothetical protein SAL07_04655 [Oscillatoria sp. PMC 1051.18]|nr:hypothetical protein [Oscillatoria sp. PMC 1050.18]MEC5029182.1 hypothetical protein [Oscillatoria sp. PMC 1051.18]
MIFFSPFYFSTPANNYYQIWAYLRILLLRQLLSFTLLKLFTIFFLSSGTSAIVLQSKSSKGASIQGLGFAYHSQQLIFISIVRSATEIFLLL